jgi:hypothetical protein
MPQDDGILKCGALTREGAWLRDIKADWVPGGAPPAERGQRGGSDERLSGGSSTAAG